MKHFLAHVLIENQDGYRSSAIVPIFAKDLEDAREKNDFLERTALSESPNVKIIERHVFETTVNTAKAIIKSLAVKIGGYE